MRTLLARACLVLFACGLFLPASAQERITLISITNSWKYNFSGTDLSGQFQQIAYNDSSWLSGPGLLGYDASLPFPYPFPILTQFPQGASLRSTIYFRTHFNFPSNTLGVVLRATNYVDDGAVFYLNGHEVQRVRLPAGSVSYNTRAIISNPEGQGNVMHFAISNLVQGDNVLAVEVHQNIANDDDIIFGMSLVALVPEPGPVRITNQPPSRTIEEADSTTFTAEIAGTPPYFFQWFKDNSPIPGATNSSLTLNFVSISAAGEYSFIVSNEFSSAVSSSATLTVLPGPYLFLSMTNAWRYHAAGVNLGVSWRGATFNDGSWAQGNGVFHNHLDALPAPKGTPLPLTNASGQGIRTWYFRARFNWSGEIGGVSLRARTLIDDGAVFYLNGAEAGRLGMPAGIIGYNTPAAYHIETPTNYTTVELSSLNLIEGENVLAVEVHESFRNTPDVVFGLSLSTNFSLSLPDLVFWGPASANTEAGPLLLSNCELMEGCATASTRRVLRFDTQTRNIGQADLILGDPVGNPLFVEDPCHGHLHFEHFAEYRLLDTNGLQVAAGNKVGFCLLDFEAWDPNASAGYVYDCEYQGIQRGWSDIYTASLPCQWIDITGLPGGTYILELHIDPENRIAESDENNNVTHVLVSFPDCPPPPNDDFSFAEPLEANPFASKTFDRQCATHEFGEPDHAFENLTSVWYRWMAPGSGKLILSTEGSNFDTLLAVYRGSDLDALALVASDDDSGTGYASRLVLSVTSGITYSIAVDGYEGHGNQGVLSAHYKPLLQPTFKSIEYLPGPQTRLTLLGGAGDNYVLESSPTLSDWTEWLRVTNSTGTVQVTDPAPGLTQKFYRALLLP